MSRYDALKLENQLCFPLYACAKEVVGLYTPYLDEIELTYTQYIAMMVLWEEGRVTVKALGKALYLDSGTLTPLLKKLEAKGLVRRARNPQDERSVIVTVTEAGMALRERAVDIPQKVGGCLKLSAEDAGTLYRLLHQMLGQMKPEEKEQEATR